MDALRRWAGRRVHIPAISVGIAALVSFQVAGYGVSSKACDFLCGLVLGIIAAGFHYDFVDGIARLDAMSHCRQHHPTDVGQQIKERIRVSAGGLLAYFFTSLSVLMLVRLFV
jgi:hypothetical protein